MEEKRERLNRKIEEKKKLDFVKKATTALEEDKKKINQQPSAAGDKPINTKRSDTMVKKTGGLATVRTSKGAGSQYLLPPQSKGAPGTVSGAGAIGDENSVADVAEMSIEGRKRLSVDQSEQQKGADDSYLDDYASFVEE